MLRALALLASLALPLAARATTSIPIRYLVDEQALKTADPDVPLVFKTYDDPLCTHEVFGTIFAAPKALTVMSRLRGLRLPGQSTKAPKAVELVKLGQRKWREGNLSCDDVSAVFGALRSTVDDLHARHLRLQISRFVSSFHFFHS